MPWCTQQIARWETYSCDWGDGEHVTHKGSPRKLRFAVLQHTALTTCTCIACAYNICKQIHAYITLHCITSHTITCHYMPLHTITYEYITLHTITYQYITLHDITWHPLSRGVCARVIRGCACKWTHTTTFELLLFSAVWCTHLNISNQNIQKPLAAEEPWGTVAC